MVNFDIIVGAGWGDEGKGKIVDLLSSKADVIVRFQGGNNAGHTLVINDKTYKLSLLPSGIVRKGKVSVIGNGVVINPFALLDEIEKIRGGDIEVSPENLIIAENACLILPFHQNADSSSESSLGAKKIGTTGRGIGPAYQDKVARRNIRICDLEDEEHLKNKLFALAKNYESSDATEILENLLKIRAEILQYASPVWLRLKQLADEGKKILFEGAQGIMLDNDFGTYPYVTSSNTNPASAFSGSGLGLQNIGKIYGIVKAYNTRVGEGPFPTEQANEIGEKLGHKGKEFGTVTGRKRRCGWLDLVMLKQVITISGITEIVLTKIDVLDDFEQINICTAYEYEGKNISYMPASEHKQAKIKPIYTSLKGWKSNIYGVKHYDDLPKQAKEYIQYIEDFTGIKVSIVSTGPERGETIHI